MRLHGLTSDEVTAIVAEGSFSSHDPQGRPIFAGRSADGRSIEIVMALDEPDYVITVFGGGRLMRADYDSEADTIQIELEAVRRLDSDDAGIPGLIVGLADGRPAMVDVIGTVADVDQRLRAAAKRHDLDAEALIAAATAARAAPDRTVTLDVAIRTAA